MTPEPIKFVLDARGVLRAYLYETVFVHRYVGGQYEERDLQWVRITMAAAQELLALGQARLDETCSSPNLDTVWLNRNTNTELVIVTPARSPRCGRPKWVPCDLCHRLVRR